MHRLLSNLLDREVPRGLADNMAEVAATHNASVFLVRDSNVTDVLNSSEDTDLNVRFHAIQVVMKLLAVARRQTQEALLNQPATVSRLMALMSDRREIVRNELLLLLSDVGAGSAGLEPVMGGRVRAGRWRPRLRRCGRGCRRSRARMASSSARCASRRARAGR